MKLSGFLFNVSKFTAYPAVIVTFMLYTYPFLFGCQFAEPTNPETSCILNQTRGEHGVFPSMLPPDNIKAPFRLLIFADPQLEGDSSLPGIYEPAFPSLKQLWQAGGAADGRDLLSKITSAAKGVIVEDIPKLVASYRKRLDLLGNDLYLAHIYRSMTFFLDPTHVTVLGDLLGSQWVSDSEFARRSQRFWKIFYKGKKVEEHKTVGGWKERLNVNGTSTDWANQFIAVVGNHDVGYAGDITREKMDRFERTFGKTNWDATFELPTTLNGSDDTPSMLDFFAAAPPSIRVIVLNSLNLDGPALDDSLRSETYDFLNSGIIASSRPVEDKKAATVLLTHIPLHKAAGVCTDAPFFDFKTSGMKEQNHLSEDASKGILEGVFGMSTDPKAKNGGRGRPGFILTGHDHTGCDVWHYAEPKDESVTWSAMRAYGVEMRANSQQKLEIPELERLEDESIPRIREVTVKSMMGEFGGNVGLLSAWFDYGTSEWTFAYDQCSLGVQHIWWGVHIFDAIVALCVLATLTAMIWEEVAASSKQSEQRRAIEAQKKQQ
ncbi:hypothetical protein MRB53_040454 [Persea americana]|nr:hypothetical protein MRB53_040454 [Persea americana]